MSTNYYFRIDNKQQIKEAVDNDDFDLARQLIDNGEIHIGKRSCGWLPLFQAQFGKFMSVKEMKQWYDENHPFIVNEYNDKLTWDELVEELITWNGGTDGAIPKTPYEVDKDSWCYDPYMPNHTPVSHFEYAGGLYSTHYFKDQEGYEFSYGDFI